MSNPALFAQHQAVLLDHGPDEFGWARAALASGEECLLFSDTAQTVPVKELPLGTILNIQEPRPSLKGPTKWISSALAINFQSVATQPIPIAEHDSGDTKERSSTQRKVQLNARYSITRHRKINQIIKAHNMTGKYAVADAVAHAIDLCIENDLI